MKKLIRLTEGDLHRIVEGAVERTLNEISSNLAGRAFGKRMGIRNAMGTKYGEKSPQAMAAKEKLAKARMLRPNYRTGTEGSIHDYDMGEMDGLKQGYDENI